MTNYRGKRALVTGGMGFIGSNLVIRLAREGAVVTVVDPCVPGTGGNPRNLEALLNQSAGQVRLLSVDIAQPVVFEGVIREADVVFNLAGEISHIHSMLNPERDLQLNTTSHLRFLQACADWRPGLRVVYAGTRQVYGVPEYLPVDEGHPINPVDFNGVHKYAATMYHLMLSRNGLLDACVLRLTNVYGPGMSLEVPGQGFLSTYLRKLAMGEKLEVFGDGMQLRDPLYVDDAVEAFLMVGAARPLPSRSYNVGGPEALSLLEIAQTASVVAGVEPPSMRPFPEERKKIDIGSYHTDYSRIHAELGWSPRMKFEDGIAETIAHYRKLAAKA